MRYFPIFMDLHDQTVVLVGAGRVAERKARQLLKAGARVCLVARELNPQFSSWVEEGKAVHLASHFHPETLANARLVFAVTGDRELNQQVFAEAEAQGIPINVVDDPRLCRFISPAVVDRHPIQVAISTGGAAPVLARRLRAWIETLLPLGIGKVAEAAGELRHEVAQTIAQTKRRAFWERLLTDKRLRTWSLQAGGDIQGQMRQALEREIGRPGWQKLSAGRVSLVGAGPGRADLLTLRALQILQQADVILHDSLVSEEILDLVRRDADRIDVGKRAGKHKHSQDEIHRLLVAEARKGRNVVRLKGGDAFIFGRGGEELEYLQAHGVACEVVPGITAAIGCAAYAGIPLTHRDHAQVLSFVTGHHSGGSTRLSPFHTAGGDWSGLAGPGKTAVVYMGVRQAASIREELLAAGVSPNLPVALVVNGTLDSQRVLHGQVDTLPQLAARAGCEAPGLFIIGQVAAVGSNLAWFNTHAVLKTAA